MPRPEFVTILQDDNLAAIWLDLCRAFANDGVLLGVRRQEPALKTIQHLVKVRWPLYTMLKDGGCTFWPGILLRHSPILWGTAADLIIERTAQGRIRRDDKRADIRLDAHGRRYTRYRQYQNRIRSPHAIGQLSEGHQMDFVPQVKPGDTPRKLIG